MMIKHIVFFRFTEDLNRAERRERSEELSSIFLPLKSLPSVSDYKVGINLSLSDYAWDVAIDSTFKSLEAFELYSKSPEHKEAIRLGKKFEKEKSVVDYKFLA